MRSPVAIRGHHMKAVGIVVLGIVALAAPAAAQDPLRAAKDLYASAAYEDALSTFTKLSSDGSETPDVLRRADQYRAFCLLALGRAAEAESVAETIVRK